MAHHVSATGQRLGGLEAVQHDPVLSVHAVLRLVEHHRGLRLHDPVRGL